MFNYRFICLDILLRAVKNYMMGNFFVGMMNELLPEKYQTAYLDIKKVGEYTIQYNILK